VVPGPTRDGAAVVGHVEWCTFAQVDHVPLAGEIVEAAHGWEDAAGGGAVAAVQIARLQGHCLLITALADDELGHRAKERLEAMGVRVEAAWRPTVQRRAFVHLDRDGERTITTVGERLQPRADDPSPWSELEGAGAVYITAGGAGAAVAARAAKHLVATPRARQALAGSGVGLDVLVASAADSGESYRRGAIEPQPRWVVLTEGAAGGLLETAAGERTRWTAPALSAPPIDSYGAGDSFAAGLTLGLARSGSIENAIELGARCGAAAVSGRGPYDGQLGGPGAPADETP
jgi:ribokinase